MVKYYYSINLLSNSRFSKSKSLEKKEIVRKKINEGLSQREIQRQTKISRVFIRQINNGYNPLEKDIKYIENNIIKKIIVNEKYNDGYYEIKTKNNDKLLVGVGNGVL